MTDACMANWWLMGGIAFVVIGLTYMVSTFFYQQRVYDLHLDHVEDMQEANQTIIDLRDKLAGREMRDRVLGATPVGRLMDKEADDGTTTE